MKSKIILGGLALLLIGGFIAYKMYNKPHQNIASSKVDIKLTSNELLKAFSEDESAANAKYLDKIISISGLVQSSKQEGDQIIVQLDAGDPMATIICNLDPHSTHTRTVFTVGEQISFKGLCSGYLSDVILDRCVEIK